MEINRRCFLKKTMSGVASVSAGILHGFCAKSYNSILGANDRINIAMMGVNSRGMSLANSFAKQENVEIIYVCDVDSRAEAKCSDNIEKLQNRRPTAMPDFRKALENKNLDAIVIAAPDHWHAPAAILASKAGKHVYLEKPCSHNPKEGEILVAITAKYKNVIQMGNQRRSYPNVVAGINELKAGVIGRPYFAKTWYTNKRPTIGRGKEVPVPPWLDYELWQGPAPRKPFKDNLIHYNWHWFWNWGTGEALNNGTHQVDLARWGLGVDYPVRVCSSGGRYHYQDDWETPDTQIISIDFDNKTSMTWEGLSCNGRPVEGSGGGVIFSGDHGSLLINGNSYSIFDLKGKLIKEVNNNSVIDNRNPSNPSGSLDFFHIRNFLDAIRVGARLNSDILSGHKSTLLVQLGNIALRSGNTLHLDPSNGHIKNDPIAVKLWSREYQKGWEPEI